MTVTHKFENNRGRISIKIYFKIFKRKKFKTFIKTKMKNINYLHEITLNLKK